MAVDIPANHRTSSRSLSRPVLGALCLVAGIAPLAARSIADPALQLGYGIAVAAILLGVAVAARRSSVGSEFWTLPFAFFVLAVVQVLNNSIPQLVQTTVLHESPVDGNPLASSVGGTVTIQLLEALLAIIPILVLTRAAGLDVGSIYARVGKVGRWHVLALVVFVGLFVLIGVRAPSYIPVRGTLSLDRYLPLAPALLVMVLSNGFEEELLFRGLFLKPLGRTFGVVWANVLQALVFAYAHLGVTYVPSAVLFILVAVFPLGLVAGYVMRKSDGIVAPALLHAALDIPIYLAFLTFVS
jgi:membrane protease YdiL (CAAX protease family)